ncbi:hypothetical protein [Poriferisphaera sp. WC338]|uniref:hypothetical protein n=1 Tax=Poriferisphaera sp. WC338 TaxID=3425129 RepID=UPI003D8144FC
MVRYTVKFGVVFRVSIVVVILQLGLASVQAHHGGVHSVADTIAATKIDINNYDSMNSVLNDTLLEAEEYARIMPQKRKPRTVPLPTATGAGAVLLVSLAMSRLAGRKRRASRQA